MGYFHVIGPAYGWFGRDVYGATEEENHYDANHQETCSGEEDYHSSSEEDNCYSGKEDNYYYCKENDDN